MTSIQPATRQQADRKPCKFTSEQCHWLIESGTLTTEHNLELIGGEIIGMAPMGDEHGNTIAQLNTWLVIRAEEKYNVRCYITLRVAEGFSPDPDFTLLKYPQGGYGRGTRPRAEDVLLIIEVADSSFVYDLGDKALAYARAGVRRDVGGGHFPSQWATRSISS